MNLPPLTPPRDLDAMLTAGAFCEWLGYEATPAKVRWANDLARTLRVPSVKIGQHYFFHPRSVLTQQDTNKTKGMK